MKQANANTIELVDRIKTYMEGRNLYAEQTGVELILIDDQTVVTRNAISLMQRNALIGEQGRRQAYPPHQMGIASKRQGIEAMLADEFPHREIDLHRIHAVGFRDVAVGDASYDFLPFRPGFFCVLRNWP